jgi:hypothetical protein
MQIQDDTRIAAIKIGIATIGAAGSKALEAAEKLTWGDWAAVATVFYIALQSFFLVRDKWWRDRRKRKSRDDQA